MKASLALMRYLIGGTELPAEPEQIVERIGSRLGAVEAITNLGPIYKDALLVKIVSAEPIAGSDHLSLCLVDDKAASEDVERNQNGLVQVVCGAPNVQAGAVAVWLPPGSIVPASVGDEPFRLGARKIMDYVSNGMLASASELGISNDHEGIVLLSPDSQYGIGLAKVVNLDDSVIDIENKMFTHRPDLFGQLGIAREVYAIFNQPFKSPKWYREDNRLSPGEGVKLSVDNRLLNDGCARFCAVAIGKIKIAPSPLWLQSYLSRCGVRPINNIVDVTNFVMIATSQPLHAYDLEASGPDLVVRHAEDNEKLTIIDGSVRDLSRDDIVIANKERAIGLGGLMGGKDSEVSKTTTSIVLECANFDMFRIRRSMMRHGIFSEAGMRFAKGQSARQNQTVLAYAYSLLKEICPEAEVMSQVLDSGGDKLKPAPDVGVELTKLQAYLGQDLSEKEILTLLGNAEIAARIETKKLIVSPPFWRTDLSQDVDIIEEVARLYGFDNLRKGLPTRLISAPEVSELYAFKLEATRALAAAGANELLTYSFVDSKLLNDCGQDQQLAYRIVNAISPGLQYYRLSLLPSLLSKVHPNHKAGYDSFVMFESGKAHLIGALDSDGLPREEERLALVVSSAVRADGSLNAEPAYYQARSYLDYLFGALGIDSSELRFDSLDNINNPSLQEAAKPLQKGRAAALYFGDICIGIIGEFSVPVRRSLKLPELCAGIELDLGLLKEEAAKHPKPYQQLPKFPKLYQDLTIAATNGYSELYSRLKVRLSELAPKDIKCELKALDAYQREAGSPVSWTFRLSVYGLERTLTDQEISKLIEELAKS